MTVFELTSISIYLEISIILMRMWKQTYCAQRAEYEAAAHISVHIDLRALFWMGNVADLLDSLSR